MKKLFQQHQEINVLSITPNNEKINNDVISKKVASERNKLVITDIGKKVAEFF